MALCLSLAAAVFISTPASSQSTPTNDRLEKLFGHYNDRTPGCALGVMTAGQLTYSHAYGMADLQTATSLTTDSIFSIGSMSKQFTAMSIVLLIEDGGVSLTDDVRKYLPELPSYGHKIAIANLLHHTSGLKDLDQLLQFSGVHLPFDLMNTRMAWSIIERQRTLNFAPGDEYSYSDTNYFLLAAIVERVSGESLPHFAKRRIFDPLGMAHTEFRADASEVIPGLASGYRKMADGFHLAPDDDEMLGDSGVFTTIGDLARWDRDFYEPVVGGQRGLDLMLARAPLNDGSANVYAAGLKVLTHRGLRMIEHAGDLPGYQSELVRFPDQQVSVAVLCNQRDDGGATDLALAAAHIILEKEFAAARPPVPVEKPESSAKPSSIDVARNAGTFWDENTGNVLQLTATSGKLSIVEPSDAEPGPLENTAVGVFHGGGVTYTFSKDGRRMDAQPAGGGHPARFARVGSALDDHAPLLQFAGSYYSKDLDRTWRFFVVKGAFVLRRDGFADETISAHRFRDTYDSDLALLHFMRDGKSRVNGFDAINYRLRKVHFERLEQARVAGSRAGINRLK
jgi:CubicO group peptidase (beta-lactamase class C family)